MASLAVIFSHAYPVLGLGTDPLWHFSREEMTAGGLAVTLFFFASGYFVTNSLVNRNGKHFFRSRLVRLYPAFAVVILMSVFVLGLFTTTLSPGDYLTCAGTWKYLLYLLMIPQYQLPGVFTGHPISLVNGSLWTMVLETLCYLGLFMAWKLRLLEKRKMLIISVLLSLAAIVVFGLKWPLLSPYADYLRPAFLFAAGVIFRLWRDRIPVGWPVAAISGGLFCLLLFFGMGNLGAVFCLPLFFSQLIFSGRQVPEWAGRPGEISYSLYLVAFPVQQLWAGWAPQTGVPAHVLLSAVSAAGLALLLYYGVEKRFAERFA